MQISFDEQNQIRVLDAHKFQQVEELEKECGSFTSKCESFAKTVQTLVEVLDSQAARIEREKLKALGQRNKAEMETETRRRQQQQIRALISSKEQELERLTNYYTSLEKVEREQKSLIERLGNNDV